jgi:hypothetical protein
MSINAGPTWRARRWARVVGLYGVMALQEARARRAGMPRGSAPSRIPPAAIAAGRAAEGHRRSGSNG